MAVESPVIILDSCENTSKHDKNEDEPATFEDVVTFLGFGKFNIIFLLTTSVAMWCNIFETTNMSYIFTSAQCDLNLSLQDKGYLNSITYAGMITSALVWGYLGDTFGRKNILITGFVIDAICIFGSSLSQNLTTLLVWKFLGGMTINGVTASLSTYLSEFHSSKYRPRIQLYFGSMVSFALTMIPLVAWLILSQDWHFSFFNGAIKIHPWNIYLMVCGLPAFTSAILLMFLPESPKFLMTTGNNDKALKIFKKIYTKNTGKPAEDFPMKNLVDETHVTGRTSSENRTKMQALMEGFRQMKPLIRRPYFNYLILACFIQMFFLQGLNMLRLWTPQIFQAVEDYKQTHNGTTTYLCTMIERLTVEDHLQEGGVCETKTEHFSVYTNAMIVSAVNMLGYSLTGTVITLLGKKKMLMILGLIGAISCMSLYVAYGSFATIALITSFTSVSNISAVVILSLVVDLFPTTLRILALSVMMMIARAGITGGNLVFPILLQLGCAPPFFVIGCLSLCSTILCFLLPNTDNKPLK